MHTPESLNASAGSRYDPATRLLRRRARTALYLALIVTIAGTWGLSLLTPRPDPAVIGEVESLQALYDGVDFSALPEVKLLQEYVGIDSAEPDPDELAGARFLARELAAAGLEPHVESMGEGRANVWAFLEGEDPKAIVLAGHIDVEPARDQEGWLFPPFGGVIDGPWIYGRGMYDMKSLTIAQLLAVTELAKRGHKPKRSVLFLATSAEETGSDTGTRWILRQHPELVARMGVVLTEGGVVEAMSHDQIKYWGIEFAQKRFATLHFCSGNRERLEDLRELLRSTGKAEPYPEIAPSVRLFLKSYGNTRGLGSYHALLANPERTLAHRASYDKLTNFMQALFRDELAPFPVVESPGGGFEMKVSAHLLPGRSLETLLAELLPEWKRLGISHHIGPVLGDGSASPVDSEDYLALESMVREAFPETPVGPYYLPWTATDSRFFREIGIPSYGFSPFPLTVTETLQIALPNERMQLPAYVRGVALYRELLGRLAARSDR